MSKPPVAYRCHWYDPQTFDRCPSTATTVYGPRRLDLCAAHLALVKATDAAPAVQAQG